LSSAAAPGSARRFGVQGAVSVPNPSSQAHEACPWQRGRKLGDIVAQFARSLAADATVGDYAYPDVREHFA
jgi:hypothetical protein